MMKVPESGIPLGAFDERRDTAREQRIGEDFGDVTDQAGHPLSGRAGVVVWHHLLVRMLERIGDEIDPVLPVAVDRRLPDTGAPCDCLDGQCAVPDFGQFFEDGSTDDGA